MPRIVEACACLANIAVETVRTDAVQSFVKQETVLVDLATDDGNAGTGYAYTIGTGGSSGSCTSASSPRSQTAATSSTSRTPFA
jgi:L-alanine-DL-glutamate epimerase-like enolase superfamily enzyme